MASGKSNKSGLRSDAKKQDDGMKSKMDTELKMVEGEEPNRNQDILSAIQSMETRISNNIKGLEDTIADKVAAAVREKMEDIRREFKEDIVDLCSRVSALEAKVVDLEPQMIYEVNELDERLKLLENEPGRSAPTESSRRDISLNVVIRNLLQRENEVTLNAVNGLIKDGLNIKDIECVSAERKQSYNDKPGVVIAKFSSQEQKKTVMGKKTTLKKHAVYKKVYINHDIPHEQRAMESSFHAILKEMGTDKLVVRGGRIVKTTRHPHNNDVGAGSSANQQPR